MNVGRKRRRAKPTNHHKSTAEVGEEQPLSQDNYGQTGGGKGNGFFSEKVPRLACASCTQRFDMKLAQPQKLLRASVPACGIPENCKLNELWVACQLGGPACFAMRHGT